MKFRSEFSKIFAPLLQGNLARSPPREGGTPLFLASAANHSPRPSSAAKAAVPSPPLVQAGQMPMPMTHPLTSGRLKPSSQQSSFEAVNPATQAKDDICRSASPNNRPTTTSTGMSLARQATEKLKWKFLGW